MDFSTLHIKRFRDLWLGQTVSQVGDGFYYILFMFMVNQITHSSAIVGIVGALEAVPFLLFGGYAGVLADRLDRRKIMLWSDLISGTTLLIFALIVLTCRQPPLWSLLAMPFLLSTTRSAFTPAKSASIPSLVPEEMVVKANAMSNLSFTATQMIGLSATAVVVSALYQLPQTVFYVVSIGLNALSFFASAVFISRLPKLLPDRGHAQPSRPWEDFKEGLRYIRGRRDLIILTASSSCVRLMISPFFVVYLAVNTAWFGGKPQLLAWMEFAFFAGMVVGTLGMTRARVLRPMVWYVYGITIVGACVMLMAFAKLFWFFVALNVIGGVALPMVDVPTPAFVQLTVPDSFRGRVNSVKEMIANGLTPVGIALGGLVVQQYGFVASFLIMGLGMIIPSWIAALDPSFIGAKMPAG